MTGVWFATMPTLCPGPSDQLGVSNAGEVVALPNMCAQDVSRLTPKLGLKVSNLESSTIRSRSSRMLSGFRISGSTKPRMSSMGYRGARGIVRGDVIVGLASVATQSRALRIASNLNIIHHQYKLLSALD